MKIIGPLFFRLFLIIFGLYVVFGALAQCASSVPTQKAVKKEFEGNEAMPRLYSYEVFGRTINYAKAGNDSLPMILFVHGSPGSWDAFSKYFKDTSLINHALLVSVDRPGFGRSGAGVAEPSIEAQAAMIAPLLSLSKSGKKPILVGHSLGGPIIARMAMDYRGQVGSLVFLAPSIDPGMEKKEWYRPLLKMGLVRAILPPGMVASNLELMPLKKELNKMLPFWKDITIPCTIMHGKKDMLVPYGNVAFFEKMLVNAPKKEVVAFEKENHFIPWTKYEAVRDKLLEHLGD